MHDADHLRIISRLSTEYVVSVFSSPEITRGRDLIDVVILAYIAAANIAHISRDIELSRRHGAVEAPEPQELKRPISALAVAEGLNLPRETCRRRVSRLVEEGVLIKGPRGLVAAYESRDPDKTVAAAERNAVLLARMIRGLKDHGLQL
jgi:hypothetical protein